MRNPRKCNCRKSSGLFGIILISTGLGIFLAHIIPYYLLIIFFGGALICLGIRYLTKK